MVVKQNSVNYHLLKSKLHYFSDSSTEKPSNLSVQNNVGTNDSSPPSEIDNSKGSSLSKDSLLCSQTGEMDTPESPDKASVSASSVAPKPSDGSTSMAFTVEFDDESPKMNISGKLEDFMPSKVRRSFRGRSDKQPKTSEDSSKEEVTLFTIKPQYTAKFLNMCNI